MVLSSSTERIRGRPDLNHRGEPMQRLRAQQSLQRHALRDSKPKLPMSVPPSLGANET